MSDTKRCPQCDTVQPISEFYPKKPRTDYQATVNRPRPWCRSCTTAYQSAYRKEVATDPERHRAMIARTKAYKQAHPESAKAYKRVGRLKKKGVTGEMVTRMHTEQGGKCAICNLPFPPRGGRNRTYVPYMVDHCHQSKKVRGLLCHHCNVGIGHFRDSTERMRAAIAYVERHSPPMVDITA